MLKSQMSRMGAKAAPTASVPYRWAEKMPTSIMTEIISTVSAYSNTPDAASTIEDHMDWFNAGLVSLTSSKLQIHFLLRVQEQSLLCMLVNGAP